MTIVSAAARNRLRDGNGKNDFMVLTLGSLLKAFTGCWIAFPIHLISTRPGPGRGGASHSVVPSHNKHKSCQLNLQIETPAMKPFLRLGIQKSFSNAGRSVLGWNLPLV
jgi:hypothetical protein